MARVERLTPRHPSVSALLMARVKLAPGDSAIVDLHQRWPPLFSVRRLQREDRLNLDM